MPAASAASAVDRAGPRSRTVGCQVACQPASQHAEHGGPGQEHHRPPARVRPDLIQQVARLVPIEVVGEPVRPASPPAGPPPRRSRTGRPARPSAAVRRRATAVRPPPEPSACRPARRPAYALPRPDPCPAASLHRRRSSPAPWSSELPDHRPERRSGRPGRLLLGYRAGAAGAVLLLHVPLLDHRESVPRREQTPYPAPSIGNGTEPESQGRTGSDGRHRRRAVHTCSEVSGASATAVAAFGRRPGAAAAQPLAVESGVRAQSWVPHQSAWWARASYRGRSAGWFWSPQRRVAAAAGPARPGPPGATGLGQLTLDQPRTRCGRAACTALLHSRRLRWCGCLMSQSALVVRADVLGSPMTLTYHRMPGREPRS